MSLRSPVIPRKNPQRGNLGNTEKFIEKILDMVNQNVQYALKKL
jgi:hypothetical protein